jgi:apolipoprotein N-acyltransferase
VRRMAVPALTLAAVLVYGALSAGRWDRPVNDAEARTVAVVQGNVPNSFRWQRAHFERALATYVDLTMRAPRGLDLIVWPENAVNFYYEREPALRAPLASVAGLARGGLVFGGPRAAGPRAAYNSAYLIDASGRLAGVYDKRRLVPFAEYNPLHPSGGATSGSDPVYLPGNTAGLLQAANARLGLSICYEALFSGLVRSAVQEGANLLVNVSNDSWLDDGDGIAPRQHFSMAVVRAVETRRYLVRAAASGISGFVTPYGRPYATLAPGIADLSVARVEPNDGLTMYVRFGDAWLGLGGLLVALTVWRTGGARR